MKTISLGDGQFEVNCNLNDLQVFAKELTQYKCKHVKQMSDLIDMILMKYVHENKD